MKKILYYTRLTLFMIYLLCILLLLNNLYKPNVFSSIYFIFNLIYSFLIILSILSKKDNFISNISYNILNIGIYIYTGMLYYIAYSHSILDLINHEVYFRNNFILMSILLTGMIIYTLIINKENLEDINKK